MSDQTVRQIDPLPTIPPVLEEADQRTPLSIQQIDENGDIIFRFRVEPPERGDQESVQELFRRTILDVLQLVRLYSGGKPLIVDAFAFLNDPEKRIRLLTGGPEC